MVADGAKAEMLTEERLGALFGVRVRVTRDDDYFHIH